MNREAEAIEGLIRAALTGDPSLEFRIRQVRRDFSEADPSNEPPPRPLALLAA